MFDGVEDVAKLIITWFCLICTAVVLGQIGRSALRCFKTWHKERMRYKLPKPPDSYRLN